MYYSYAPQELMVEIGDYGMGMTLILAGACKVIPGATDNTEPWVCSSRTGRAGWGTGTLAVGETVTLLHLLSLVVTVVSTVT